MSVTDDNSDLIGPLTSLSIKESRTVEEEADHELLPGEHLLKWGGAFFSHISIQERHQTNVLEFWQGTEWFASTMGFYIGCVVFAKQLM